MAGQIKVDSINADSNLALKIANTTVAFIDSSGLRPVAGNLNLDATATSKFYLPSANTVAIQTAGVTAVTVDSSQNTTLAGTASATKLIPTGSSVTGNGMYLPAANSLGLSTNGTNAVYVDSSQNVGIGNTAPADRLQIEKANANCLLSVSRTTGGAGGRLVMQHTDSVGALQTTASVPLVFGTNDTERMRIDTSGNLLVGGTSAYGTNPKITVVGGVTISISNSNYRNIYMSGDTNLYFNNGANQGYLSSAGAWTNASDARLKKDIVEIKYGLQSVLNTKPRSYNRVDVAGEYIGFVAQELIEVIPEVVSGDPEVQFGVDYGSLVAVAFKAIQEQQAIIAQLQADVATLKALKV